MKNIFNKISDNFENKNFKRYVTVMILIFCIVAIGSSYVYGATDPTLVTKINSAFKKILGYLQKIATPIAGVTIATGVLMRKLSFGDDERMIKGKKVIVNAIIGYAIIISIDLIIKFIDALI